MMLQKKQVARAATTSGPMNTDSHENRLRRFVISVTTRLLAAFMVLSFLATLLPVGSVAAKSIMACCAGKSASHCHASLKPNKTNSVSDSCRSDCCVCCAPARQAKRERITPQPIVKLALPTVVASTFANITVAVPARAGWAPVAPRGPPAFFVEQIS